MGVQGGALSSGCAGLVGAAALTDWEAVCVDDGSPDASGAILDEYARADSRFRVIHQANGGVSRARGLFISLKTRCSATMCVRPRPWERLRQGASIFPAASPRCVPKSRLHGVGRNRFPMLGAWSFFSGGIGLAVCAGWLPAPL
ncbi:MAG: glycosyltransferase [Akkermansia sp.]